MVKIFQAAGSCQCLQIKTLKKRSKLLWVESAGVAAIAFELAAVWEMRRRI